MSSNSSEVLSDVSTLAVEALLKPSRLYRGTEVLNTPVVPTSSGVYAWYFRQLPPEVPSDGCRNHKGVTLLYVGIAPRRPPGNGKPPSKATLRSRLRAHYDDNAEGSTLRLTLGCLLAQSLALELRRLGSGKRRTFANGEHRLSRWMHDNAFVCWVAEPKPWILEADLIADWSLPLNLKGNEKHPFYARLSALRSAAKKRADNLPVWAEDHGLEVER